MTISKVMGVTTYSTVMNVADTDIANVMGVAQGGGGGATLLEGFEATPFTGLYANWNDVSTGTLTISRTTSHVTQGTYTWRMESGAGTIPDISTNAFDVSALIAAPTQFLIDIYAQTLDPLDIIVMLVVDDNTATNDFGIFAGTGATTLTVPIVNITDFTAIRIEVLAVAGTFGPTNGAVDFYIDNLRAT